VGDVALTQGARERIRESISQGSGATVDSPHASWKAAGIHGVEVRGMAVMSLRVMAFAGGLAASAAWAASGPFVYPLHGQSQAQQDQDRAACESWARGQTGGGSAPPATGRPTGATVGGAARGAAVGAAVGAIAGDAGKGAGAGAVVGGVGGRRRGRAEQQAAAASAQDTYLRAFSACMEGRGYSVR
jgi:hypothetical protein